MSDLLIGTSGYDYPEWKGYHEKLKRYNSIPVGWEEELLQFQRIFKKFQDKFHEYFEYPLFNGEGSEEE